MSIWNGLAGDGLWSTDGNWSTPPVGGNSLEFPAGAAGTNTNDLGPGRNFVGLTLGDTGYVINGTAISLSGPLEVTQGVGTDTINLPIVFQATTTVSVDPATATLVLGGPLSGGAVGLTKQGAGELDLTDVNTYTGTTTVSAGVLRVEGTQPGSPVSLGAGTTLRGGGQVGAISSAGATVSPGGALSTILTDAGDLSLDSASTFAVTLNGTTAGTDYSQLAVAGQVTLGGATLSTTVGFTPTGNESFIIINNTGSAAVNGTFAGLAEGSEFSVGGESYQITYAGGDGNDVVLTHLLETSTDVGAVPTSSVFGQQVTLTATVSTEVGTPTGTVQFFTGGTSLGTAPLSGGTATLQTSALPVGTDQVTATYLGDDSFAMSTSPEFGVTVAQANTATTLSAGTPNPSVAGQQVALTATVAAVAPGAGTPTGSVEFFNGATSLGTVTLSGGTATLNTSALPVGSDSVTAHYQGDTNFVESTSNAVDQTVNQASTTTSVAVAPNPSSLGQSVLLTATVAPVAPGTGTATGTVEFFAGSTSLGTAIMSGGVAVLSTAALPQGTSAITAHYLGDTNFVQSTSQAVTATVNQGTTTALNVAPTSITYGQQVTMTATVAPSGGGGGTPTGNVTFKTGTTPLGTAVLINGVATLTTGQGGVASLPGGTNQITAEYAGEGPFGSSTSAQVPVTVALATTTSALAAAPNPASLGQIVTLTATVSSPSASAVRPSGNVQFFNGATSLGTAVLDSSGVARLQTAALPLGANSVTALYAGDGNYSGSSAPAITVTVKQGSTTTLSVSPASSVFSQPVTLRATIVASGSGTGTPTGTVEFMSGNTSLGIANVSGGVATLTLPNQANPALPVGASLITAKYSGDGTFNTSTSPAQTATVKIASSATTVTISPNPSSFSQPVTLTATVTAVAPATGTPTGTVQFFAGSTSLGTATLTNGVATLPTTSLPLGTSSVTARYQATTNFDTSTSPAVTATVTRSNATTVTLTTSKEHPVAFEAVTLTATVTGGSTGTGTPTGDVVFVANGRVIGSSTLSNGVATLVTANLPVGNVILRAVYQGDDNFRGAQSSTLTMLVGDQVERYLNQVYVDALHRTATLSELDLWRTQLTIGVPRAKVVSRIVNSPEGQIASVRAVYQNFLRRQPSRNEIVNGIKAIRARGGFAFEATILGGREYFRTQGGGTNSGFLTALFRDVLGIAVPADARIRLTRALQRGVSRTEIARALVQSQSGKTALVNFLFKQTFGRPATSGESSLYVTQLNRGSSIQDVFINILASDTFFARFREPVA